MIFSKIISGLQVIEAADLNPGTTLGLGLHIERVAEINPSLSSVKEFLFVSAPKASGNRPRLTR